MNVRDALEPLAKSHFFTPEECDVYSRRPVAFFAP